MDSDLSDDNTSSWQRSRYNYNGRPTRNGIPPRAPVPPSATSVPANTGTQSGMGLSDSALSESRRRKLDVINRLRSLGAERDIDIPQIVVIGSQSAGKSSLIESISGITLPRQSGTCTRCPTECRLVHSIEPWQCTVSLRFMKDASGQPLDLVRNIPFGLPIKDPKHVEERLRRAQRAILNPPVDPLLFLETNQQQSNLALAFSANCVSLEIRGPDVTDLSFCDLPGLIASVGDHGRDEDVEEVKALVSSYIKKPGCIVLLTVTCETDFETQGAYRLAKQYDPQGTRTIGVLTKPDRIPDREEGRWLGLIKNESSVLQHGWFCVKQPSTKELETGLTFLEARRRGEEFFKSPPWSTLEAKHRRHLGTEALTKKLNEFLMTVISNRLPEIMQELQAMLQKTKEELQGLPPPVSKDPVMELMHLVNEFSDELHRHAECLSHDASGHMEGEADARNQFLPIGRAHEKFRWSIRATVPQFLPFEAGATGLPVDDTQESPPPIEPLFLRTEEEYRVNSVQGSIHLDGVVERVREATTRELPGYFPFHVLQDLISMSTDRWENPARKLIDIVHQIVVKHQDNLIQKYFAEYTGGGLCQTVSNLMQEYTQRRRDDSMGRIKWLLELEAHAFTLNKHQLNDYRNKFLEYYKQKRQDYLGGLIFSGSSVPWNPSQSALEIMATVRAYFQVAYKRVVDTVPLAIDRELVRVEKRAVQNALYNGLRITGPEAYQHCLRLLAEPPEVAVRRSELDNQLTRLEAARAELMQL